MQHGVHRARDAAPAAADFPAAAGLYGLNHTTKIGIPALMANVPKPSDEAELAATAIGQASVVFSPLGMATVARRSPAVGRGCRGS